MKKSIIGFICAISVFFTSVVTSYASSSIEQSTHGYIGEQLACYYFLKAIGLTDHPVHTLSGSYIDPTFSTSNYQPIRSTSDVLYNPNSGGSLSKTFYFHTDDTTIHVSYITNDSRNVIYNPTNASLHDNSIHSNGYYLMDYNITSTTSSSSFGLVVYGGSWCYPVSYSSDTNDDSLQAIIDLLTTTNSTLSTISGRINTTNTRLNTINSSITSVGTTVNAIKEGVNLIYAQLSGNDDNINYQTNSTNLSLGANINSLESIESTYFNDLNSNLPSFNTSSNNFMIGSYWSTDVYTFITSSLESIYNSDTQIKSFTNTVLILGFALIMIGVFV